MNSEGLLILAGNLEAWFYQTLTSINHDPEQPGFKHIILKPHPVGDPSSSKDFAAAGLTEVKAWPQSMHGKIVSDWKIVDGKFRWKVTVPPNTTATAHLPATRVGDVTEGGRKITNTPGVTFLHMHAGRAVCELESGSYEFLCKSSPTTQQRK